MNPSVGRSFEAMDPLEWLARLCDHIPDPGPFAPVGRPTGNAVAELFILTMKSELIWTREWDSAEELRPALVDWPQQDVS